LLDPAVAQAGVRAIYTAAFGLAMPNEDYFHPVLLTTARLSTAK
jgi:hypothetical protein